VQIGKERRWLSTIDTIELVPYLTKTLSVRSLLDLDSNNI
jgi:hypothetical protein